jgi:hypothetical protein
MEIKFELNDGCLGIIPLASGRFGVISVQRDLLELMFVKSIPKNSLSHLTIMYW